MFLNPIYITNYINILVGEGYERIFRFGASYDAIHDLRLVERYETTLDTVFIHSAGHGGASSGISQASYYNSLLKSDEFRSIIDDFDTDRKGWLFDHCQSGYFVWNFNGRPYPYLAISSTDDVGLSWGTPWGERTFSCHFFIAVSEGLDWYYAFTRAWSWASLPGPQYLNNSPYNFFED